jgi:hypothetical protein
MQGQIDIVQDELAGYRAANSAPKCEVVTLEGGRK